jgi:3-hydroxyacyl-CoA dehydrogenase
LAHRVAEGVRDLRPLPRVRDWSASPPAADVHDDAVRRALAAHDPRVPAPRACVACVAAACTHTFDEGLAFERAQFVTLMMGAESKALRHAFFAERAASRVPGVSADTPARPLERIVITGVPASAAAHGVASAFQSAGLSVTVVDHDDRALADADCIIDAEATDLATAQARCARLAGIARDGAVLAITDAELDMDAIASATARPGDVVGLHLAGAAPAGRLLEVRRVSGTAPDVIATMQALARRLRRVAVVSTARQGGIGHRLLQRFRQQARVLLEAGCTVQQIDAALAHFGVAPGPMTARDLAAGPERTSTRDWSDDEIAARLVYALANEGAVLLDDGVAARASDIDVVLMLGFGVPAWRGGAMHHAEHIGLYRVARALGRWAREPLPAAASWTPAPLLVRLADEQRTFADVGVASV